VTRTQPRLVANGRSILPAHFNRQSISRKDKEMKYIPVLRAININVHAAKFKQEFFFEIGWFPGEPFKLIGLQLCEFDESVTLFTILRIEFLHFTFGFGVSW
jgi:hypothetical protein